MPLQAAGTVDRVSANCFFGQQWSGGDVAMDPGLELTQPLLRIQFRLRPGPRLELPTNGLDADGDHVIRFADQPGLNRLPDQPLFFRVQLNRHAVPSLDYLKLRGSAGDSATTV